jgi:hypothetical protein
MEKERLSIPNKKKLRNLGQFKDMSDEEFDIYYKEKYLDENLLDFSNELEEEIARRRKLLEEDYDFEDMKANDLVQLRSLILAMIQLEDLELEAHELRQDVASNNILILDKINRMMSALRSDISDISEDLQLTRKIRAKSKDVSLAKKWEDLRARASEFYKKKMLYVFCEECRTLLATVWLIYPDEESNILKLKCNKCGNTFNQELSVLYEQKHSNLDDILIP